MYIQKVHIGGKTCICTREQCETVDQMPMCVTWGIKADEGLLGAGTNSASHLGLDGSLS